MSSSNGKAIVCRDTLTNGGWKLEDVSVRKPGEGELLVEMVASVRFSICPMSPYPNKHPDNFLGRLPHRRLNRRSA
jgi:hypothetical protein